MNLLKVFQFIAVFIGIKSTLRPHGSETDWVVDCEKLK